MDAIARSTPAREMAKDRACDRCGNPTPVITTGLAFHPQVPSRFCAECLPIVEAEEREQERSRQAGMLIERAVASLPQLRGWSLESFPVDEHSREAKATVLKWFEGFLAGSRANLLIFGPVGTGKTGLAWGLIREACEQLVDSLHINWPIFLWDCKKRMAERVDFDERPHYIPLLSLDDLGAERRTPFALDSLLTLVEHRHTQKLPTIATSNWEPGALAERWSREDPNAGDRIISRLVEGAVQIRLEGPDRRVA